MAGPGGDAWFDSSGAPGGLAGLLCHAEDVRVEAAFWSAFARARWSTVGDEGAWGSVSSPLLPAPCRLVILPAEGDRPRHAMNDCGFPSIGVAATAIDADCARALAAGATLRAEPIVTTVGGRPLRMALIETPGGAPVELLSVHRDGSRGRPAARRAPVAPAASGAHPIRRPPQEQGPMTFTLDGPVLEGAIVRLEPLEHRHLPDLAVAAEEDRSSYGFTWVPTADQVGRYIDEQHGRASAGRLAPYAQIERSSGRAVGATAFWDPRPWPGEDRLCAVEIGFTWLAPSAQGTGLNLEAKLLLFRHAFEVWDVARVDLKTDARNARSRAAIEKAGARFEGAAQLVQVLGAGRGRPAARFGDVLGGRRGVAALPCRARTAAGRPWAAGTGTGRPPGRRVVGARPDSVRWSRMALWDNYEGLDFQVVANRAGQYSLWPGGRPLPPGWAAAGRGGPWHACLEEIDETWRGGPGPEPRPLPGEHGGGPAPEADRSALRGPRRALPDGSITELIRARGLPAELTAARCGEQRLSRGELFGAAAGWARVLTEEGCGREVPVALLLPRGLDALTAILAVLEAGGAYVPVSCDDPAERIRAVLADCGARIVVTTDELADTLRPHAGVVLSLSDLRARAEHCTARPRPAAGDDLAYVFYTSGTTGRPKGVEGTHRQLVNYALWCAKAFAHRPGRRPSSAPRCSSSARSPRSSPRCWRAGRSRSRRTG